MTKSLGDDWNYENNVTYVIQKVDYRLPTMINGQHYVSDWMHFQNTIGNDTSKLIITNNHVKIIWKTSRVVEKNKYRIDRETVVFDIPLEIFTKTDNNLYYNVKFNSEMGKVEFNYHKSDYLPWIQITLEDQDLKFICFDKKRYDRDLAAQNEQIRQQRKSSWD